MLPVALQSKSMFVINKYQIGFTCSFHLLQQLPAGFCRVKLINLRLLGLKFRNHNMNLNSEDITVAETELKSPENITTKTATEWYLVF